MRGRVHQTRQRGEEGPVPDIRLINRCSFIALAHYGYDALADARGSLRQVEGKRGGQGRERGSDENNKRHEAHATRQAFTARRFLWAARIQESMSFSSSTRSTTLRNNRSSTLRNHRSSALRIQRSSSRYNVKTTRYR